VGPWRLTRGILARPDRRLVANPVTLGHSLPIKPECPILARRSIRSCYASGYPYCRRSGVTAGPTEARARRRIIGLHCGDSCIRSRWCVRPQSRPVRRLACTFGKSVSVRVAELPPIRHAWPGSRNRLPGNVSQKQRRVGRWLFLIRPRQRNPPPETGAEALERSDPASSGVC
jgi:hypothetical protein